MRIFSWEAQDEFHIYASWVLENASIQRTRELFNMKTKIANSFGIIFIPFLRFPV